ncbi:MAG: hypothetical protein OXO52_01575 [Rhodospirillales bacterium]|nr:hypothetical protein [Rhodospirillales bacterium]MDE0381637.1 hypothetical protein [Rhodospirillales bacterium]
MINKHRRLQEFQEEDYDILVKILSQVDKILVTPNTLTEASNLLTQHGEPQRSRFLEVLRTLIEDNEEVVIASQTASQNSEFTRLGLTDSGLLEVISDSNPVVTVDLSLYLAAIRKESGSAYNFRHYQSWP